MDKNVSVEAQADQGLMHNLTGDKTSSGMKPFVILCLAVLFGLGAGFVLAKATVKPAVSGNVTLNKNAIQQGKTYGSNDTKAFPDMASGKVEIGGIKGEGQYHLVRPGGDSQNVYMTSSTVDLGSFVGKTVKVWGQTQAAKTAGWLMDVGRVQVQ